MCLKQKEFIIFFCLNSSKDVCYFGLITINLNNTNDYVAFKYFHSLIFDTFNTVVLLLPRDFFDIFSFILNILF